MRTRRFLSKNLLPVAHSPQKSSTTEVMLIQSVAACKCFLIDKGKGRHLFSIMGQVEWKASFLYMLVIQRTRKKALIRREMYHFVLMLL